MSTLTNRSAPDAAQCRTVTAPVARPRPSRRLPRSSAALLLVLVPALVASLGSTCSLFPFGIGGSNPFANLPDLPFDGMRRALTSENSSLGFHAADEVLKITVFSGQAVAAFILAPDTDRVAPDGTPLARVIIDGGFVTRVGEEPRPFLHRVRSDGRLFLFIEAPANTTASVALESGPADYRPPAGQSVVLEFEDDFLASALVNPDTGTDEDRAFLRSIEPTVREDLVTRIREIYAGTAVTILGPADARPGDCSVVTFSGCAVFLGQGGFGEALVNAAPNQSAPCNAIADASAGTQHLGDVVRAGDECSILVRFGEVLPAGSAFDAGNRIADDRAVVYVGSFRRPPGCTRTPFTINSVNNIVNTLALSGAHEIGHLLGLTHTALEGLMAAQPSIAFQRQFSFNRSQIIQAVDPTASRFAVVTTVIQDPAVYFDHIFSGP